ncbi:hypothetical protein [Tuberibacillus sp. Marseille-P3662]|uniref:hypothetical protein n=1 Tax=Tuberibacillus sp. Marseille-P3662 TaxID=1965358 RepID=UPI000A1C9C68|nr:hypothetical protein [Tuberibacillus sp. Marseille-P3662]
MGDDKYPVEMRISIDNLPKIGLQSKAFQDATLIGKRINPFAATSSIAKLQKRMDDFQKMGLQSKAFQDAALIGKRINPFAATSSIVKLQKRMDDFQKIGLQSKAFQDAALIGKRINSLVATGSIAKLQKRINNLSNIGLKSKDLQEASKLIQSVNLGIPDDFLENINQISNLYVADYDQSIQSDSKQNIEKLNGELNQELNDNPVGIWSKLNSWATYILESRKTLAEKQPFIYLILSIFFSLYMFVLQPAVDEVMKNQVLHEVQLSEVKPKQNAKVIKINLVHEYEIPEKMLTQVRVTSRETPVFLSSKIKSGKIDSLDMNKPVIILHKKRNWSFIKYTNESGSELTGWVFTRNLTK